MKGKLRFPVTTFNKFSTIGVFFCLEDLLRTTSAGLKNGLYDNLEVVDSDGVSTKVVSATKLRGIGPFWGYNILLNQNILVEVEFGDEQQISLDKLKSEAIKSVKAEEYFYNSAGNYKKTLEMINKAESIEGLIYDLDKIVNVQFDQEVRVQSM